MIRDYNWSRGGHYDAARSFPGTYFGTSGFRANVIAGPGYHIHDGTTPLTKEALLADPMAREGTWDFPPIDLLDTLGMHACVMEINYSGPYGSASGTQRVQRNGSWHLTNGEASPPPTDEDLKRCSYWKPGSSRLDDDPLHRFIYPGYFLDMNNRNQASDIPRLGGADIPYGFMGSFSVRNISGESVRGDDIEIETGIPIGGESEENYVMKLATYYNDGPQESASANIQIDTQALYFPVHQVWLLPVTASGSSQESEGNIILIDPFLYEAVASRSPEDAEILAELLEEEYEKFYTENRSSYHRARPFGPAAYSSAPVPPSLDQPYLDVTYDTDFVSASFRDPELSEVFLPFELAAS
jgi:hypothetical protein